MTGDDMFACRGTLQKVRSTAVVEERHIGAARPDPSTRPRRSSSGERQARQAEAFRSQLEETLTSTGWEPARIQKVRQVLQPTELNRLNEKILSSPMAVVQLANLYTLYDEKTGQFDFSSLVDVRAESRANQQKQASIQKDRFASALSQLGGRGKMPENQNIDPKTQKRIIRPKPMHDPLRRF